MRQIDAHQHFWQPLRGDYDWMPRDNPILNRQYRPQDLAGTLRENLIEGTVLVQAAATVAETEYMLGLADGSDFVLGVVGWIDFEDPAQEAVLRRLAQHPRFKGVRPMIQDIDDINWMLRDDIQWAYRAICDLDLSFDALGYPEHIPNFLKLVKKYPSMRVVFDHCMKPRIRDQMAGKDAFGAWASGMSRLADQTAGYLKFSGLVTEAAEGWTLDDLRPFALHVLEAFGPSRVMWGSDWPVCRLRAEYGEWRDAAKVLTADFTGAERARIFGGTATEFYRLDGG